LFKKVFADQRYAHILIGFIQDVYDIKVESVQIETPYSIDSFNQLDHEKLAFTEVDVVARLSDNSLVTIEMQVQRQKYYTERALYYVANKYVSNYGQERYYQGKTGDSQVKYSSLYPVYGLSILDFKHFEKSSSSDALRHFELYDVNNEEYLQNQEGMNQNLLKLSFLELPRTLSEHQRHLKDWIDYFTKGKVASTAPDYIQEACEVIAYQNLGREERKMVDHIEKAREDYKASIAYYKDEGREEGKKEGRQEQTLSIAQNMLKEGISLETIQRVTGLKEEELYVLQQK